jgi:hypothetical protein
MKFEKVLNETDTVEKYRDKFMNVRMNKFTPEKVEKILKKLDGGKLFIEFARAPEPNSKNNVKLLVSFDPDISWLLNRDKGIQSFNSAEELKKYIIYSVNGYYQNSDLKSVYKWVFNPKAFDKVIQQIKEYIDTFSNKTKSLSYSKETAKPGEKNPSWDMEVIFRVNRAMRTRDNDFDTRLYPSISGIGEFGRIMGKDEIEVEDPSLW